MMKQSSMYETMPAVAALNRVEDFEPHTLMREIEDSQGQRRMYLDVQFRKLWFRLKHPGGKIVKRIVKLTDQCAVVEARIYLNQEDTEDSYIANAFGLRFYGSDTEFGPKYLELAETAATGRALADAGFGSQFADVSGEYDPAQVDAGLSQEPTPEQQNTDSSAALKDSSPCAEPVMPQPAVLQEPAYTPDMSVEDIVDKMTLEEAMRIPVSFGTFRGQPLGPTAAANPNLLAWILQQYKGPDNVVRAAARLLYDTAMEEAG